MNYALDAQNLFGFGAFASVQMFDETNAQPSFSTYVYQVFGVWSRKFGALTSLTITGGPALIVSRDPFDQVFLLGMDVNGNPIVISTFNNAGGGRDSTVTFFGSVDIRRDWTPSLTTLASYRRDQNNGSGQSGTQISDLVTVSLNWTPGELWQLALNGSFINRESALSGTDVNGKFSSQRWFASSRVSRRLTRNASLTMLLRYSTQSGDNRGGSRGNIDDFAAILGFRYSFDTIRI